MNKKSGFTLVELVVVIMILGILAGVAAPKFLSTSGTATDNGLRQTLSIVRDAIELYAADNAGQLPPCTGTGADFRGALEGTYLRGTFPKSPVGSVKDNLVKAGSAADGVTGWMFDTSTGEFIANETSASNSGTTYDNF